VVSERSGGEADPAISTTRGALNPAGAELISPRNSSGYHELQVLIQEMAHELKNPMVTIKTFAQLLAERFDDVAFRVRFQETVNEDIDRMDELVETLLQFSRFAKPEITKILVHEHLRKVLVEIVPECIKKDTSIRWGRKGEDDEVFVDSAQFSYVMENLLLSVLNQIKEKEEIQIDIEKGGRIVISYPSDGEPGVPQHYMDLPTSAPRAGGLPLRMLLAKILLERNGGRIEPNLQAEGRVQIEIALPVS
jgi:polar amino acid transport system substrate-binding protein